MTPERLTMETARPSPAYLLLTELQKLPVDSIEEKLNLIDQFAAFPPTEEK